LASTAKVCSAKFNVMLNYGFHGWQLFRINNFSQRCLDGV
jgi:hypothetical protein